MLIIWKRMQLKKKNEQNIKPEISRVTTSSVNYGISMQNSIQLNTTLSTMNIETNRPTPIDINISDENVAEAEHPSNYTGESRESISNDSLFDKGEFSPTQGNTTTGGDFTTAGDN